MSIEISEILSALADKKIAYSIESLQRELDVGRSTIYEELNAKRLRAKKLNKQTLIPIWHVIQWLDALPDYEPGRACVIKGVEERKLQTSFEAKNLTESSVKPNSKR